MTEEGPTLKIYMQQHPHDEDQFVNVMILENYLSSEYMDEWQDRVNEMPFQQNNNGKFLRVASLLGTGGAHGDKNALMTFGRFAFRAYESTPHLSEYEEGIIEMTTKMHRVIDDVLEYAIATLKSMGSSPTRSARPKRSTRSTRSKSSPSSAQSLPRSSAPALSHDPNEDEVSFVYPLPASGQPPLDAPDSVASHATANSPYDHHCDTRDRPDNHNNGEVWSHEDQMRILTHCMVEPIPQREGPDTTAEEPGSVPDVVVTIR